ncbi:cation:proton antiporter [Candidatus Peregrinibacteria bacterium]|jgi:Kef-type K+ transport system membrane component KefB|nr:cation:proton antiporter [Candidatus Peregrinibacteria bacterium]
MDFHSLLILMVIVYSAGKIFRYFHLPVLFGELLGGIIAGPVLLGLVQPGDEIIKVIAELGIFFLMLHSGLETDPRDLMKSFKSSTLVALGGVILPFGLGYFVTRYFGYDVMTSAFVAMGVSITAIALCVRLFKDYGLTKTKAFHVAMGAAMVDDIVSLIMFSVIIGIVETGGFEPVALGILLVKVVLFFAVIMWAGFKLAKHLNRLIYSGNRGFTVTLIIALIIGLLAEAIGLHIIIGAFLAGLFIREEIIDSKAFHKIEDRVYGMAYFFFGPVFFASLAFHLDFTIFIEDPWYLVALIVVSVVGKLFGCGLIARFLKLSKWESLAVGIGMNSRGAVELIIASIGISLGIINETIFSALVIMAFVTTLMSILMMKPVAKHLTLKGKAKDKLASVLHR